MEEGTSEEKRPISLASEGREGSRTQPPPVGVGALAPEIREEHEGVMATPEAAATGKHVEPCAHKYRGNASRGHVKASPGRAI